MTSPTTTAAPSGTSGRSCSALPCARCGDAPTVWQSYSTKNGHGYAACCRTQHPGRVGPWAVSKRKAIVKWNGMQIEAQNARSQALRVKENRNG